jgi:small-conductance mechanosensitive channel
VYYVYRNICFSERAMDDVSTVLENARHVVMRALTDVVDYLPTLLGASILLLAGWAAARLLRAGTNRAGDNINRILDRVFRSGRLADLRLSARMLAALAEVIFWLTLFVFASIAARAAGLATFATWLERIVANLPNFIAGVLVIVVGFFLGAVVRDLATATTPAGRTAQGLLIGKAAQVAVIIIALVIGLDQIGINVTFIVTVLAIAIGVSLGGFAIGFGLGARGFVANLIGARELKREIEPGQVIRFGENEGEVLEITATTLVLATKDGRRRIPAGIFATEPMTIVDSDSPHD